MEPSDQPTLEPRPGPGAVVPKLLTVVGSLWLVWSVWTFSGRIVRLRPRLPSLRAAVAALLSALD
jgi:hypothetical protein